MRIVALIITIMFVVSLSISTLTLALILANRPTLESQTAVIAKNILNDFRVKFQGSRANFYLFDFEQTLTRQKIVYQAHNSRLASDSEDLEFLTEQFENAVGILRRQSCVVERIGDEELTNELVQTGNIFCPAIKSGALVGYVRLSFFGDTPSDSNLALYSTERIAKVMTRFLSE